MKKAIIALISHIVVLSMMIIIPVKALDHSLALTNQDDQIAVTLHIGDTNEDALTLKATFKVEAEDEKLEAENIQFHFNDSINSVIKEYRYDNGLLTIYISGEENLFANQQIQLGTIDFHVPDNTKIQISYVKDSLEYVTSTYSKSVLDVQDASIEWDNISTPSNNDDQDSSNDQQNPDQGTNDVAKDDTKSENSQVSSSSQTGDKTNGGIYIVLALGSLTAGLYLLKRKYQKIHE